KSPAEQDDPDDVADEGTDAHPPLAGGDGPAERPQHIVSDPERGDPERDRDDQEEQDEADQPGDRIGDGHPYAAEHQPDHVQDRSHRIPQSWFRAPPALPAEPIKALPGGHGPARPAPRGGHGSRPPGAEPDVTRLSFGRRS